MKLTKKATLITAALWILFVFGTVFSVLSWFISPYLCAIGVLLLIILAVAIHLYHGHLRSLMLASYTLAAERLSAEDAEDLEKFPFPALVCDQERRILYNNRLFVTDVMAGKSVVDLELDRVLRDIRPDFTEYVAHFPVQVGAKEFTAFVSSFERNQNRFFTYYFVEDTKQKQIIREYHATRPAVMLLYIDNLEDTVSSMKESEKMAVLGRIEALLDEFMDQTSGFMAKIDRDRFLAVVEERHIAAIIEDKFSILDQVRDASPEGGMPVTLSIGVSRGAADLLSGEKDARKALDMALGRGGDQAAVLGSDGYSFFGGVSKGVEKRSKIKTRVMASAISELITHSDSVLVMGHRNADIDSLASATGMAKAARNLGKRAYVVLKKNENLAGSLLEMLEDGGLGEMFLSPEEAMRRIAANTLLIVTDTHSNAQVESEQVLDACRSVVVIDHHRKSVNFIEKAVIFYHEPFASSASEMVAELCQYISQGEFVGRIEAEALLAGISLDTHSFSTQAGVRTFEAAAWLRSRGADMTRVKRLFRNSSQHYHERTSVVRDAEITDGCAISFNRSAGPMAQMISSQAADELLSLNGVRASFVFYENENRLGLCARSFGDVNVQLIMEALGGGGHQNMAGTRFAPEVTKEEAEEMLRTAIANQLAVTKSE